MIGLRQLLLVATLVAILGLLGGAAHAESIHDQIYRTVSVQPCNRLLHRTGEVGCGTPKAGLQGHLRYAGSIEDLDAFLGQRLSYRAALVLEPELFVRNQLERLQPLDLAGIVVLRSVRRRTEPFSPALPAPQTMVMHEDDWESAFVWNPDGQSLILENFEYAIVRPSETAGKELKEMALWNEAKARKDEFPAHVVEFKYKMFGTKNSFNCLKEKRCMPLGGHSVWASYGPVNDTDEVVVGMAPMDSSAFFHDAATGANADMTGVVAVLGAAATLADVPNVAKLPRKIVFAFFQGEAWSFVGSRRFVADLSNFTCDVPSEPARDPSKNHCKEPFRPDLAFTRLKLENIHRMLELNQIGLNDTLFLHHDGRPAHPGVTAWLDHLKLLAADVPDITVEVGAQDTPSVPPSSSMAFLKELPELPAAVLTDHFREYANRFYHSLYDDHKNVLRSGTDVRTVTASATLMARALFESAGGDPSFTPQIHADSSFVSQLWDCLTKDYGCSLVSRITGRNYGRSPRSHYTGVYQLMLPRYISGMPLFLHGLMSELSQNASRASNLTDPVPTSNSDEEWPSFAHWHDAVDPLLDFDYDAEIWRWREDGLNETMLWTESNWGSGVNTRVFRVEDPAVSYVMLGAGVALTLLSWFASRYAWRFCPRPKSS